MMARRDYFYTIADNLGHLLRGGEVFTCYFTGEDSDFVRFNRSRIRQAGHVTQQAITLDLIEGCRHAAADVSLSGDLAVDRSRLRKLLGELRAIRAQLPEDPHLNYAREDRSSEQLHPNCLPPATEMVEHILAAGEGQDLVGILASGAIDTGFANSLGQRNWFSRCSFNLDWSLYLHTDKAVKGCYAGFTWQQEEFANRLRSASEQLEVLIRPARNLPPGRYRVYLTPMAVDEIIELLSWSGFSLRAHRTGTTPLLHMVEQSARLHPAVTVTENTAAGIAPNFQAAGFIRPPQVTLIDKGIYRDCLVAPRSAVEYGVPSNAAGEGEAPLSVEVAAGTLPTDSVLKMLDTGLYVSNLWYLNWSDRNAARITGMTRFATFWVDQGRIEAPVTVMRFDETIYHLFGDYLLGLTAEREVLLSPSSYGARSTRSARLPGILVGEMNFTL